MFCKNCGFNLGDDTRFCPNCGTKVEQDMNDESNLNKTEASNNLQMDQTMQMPYTRQMIDNEIIHNNSTSINGQTAGNGKKIRSKSKKSKYVVICLVVVILLILGVAGTIFLRNNLKTGSIKKNIESGNKYVDQGRFKDAKAAYEKAIDLDKKNKDTYLVIKDKYVKAGRLDDAYAIIKLAMSNGVMDMKAQLDDIAGKFEVTSIEDTCSQNGDYALPMDVTLKLNGEEEVQAAVTWKNGAVDTKKVGTVELQGTAEAYGRAVKLSLKVVAKISSIKSIEAAVFQGEEFKLPGKVKAVMSDRSTVDVNVTWNPDKADTSKEGVQKFEGTVAGYSPKVRLTLTVKVKEIVTDRKIGNIKRVYEESGKKYIQVDEVEWYTGEKAVEEAKKDGNAEVDENGKYFVPNDYYVRDKTHELTTYEVAENASFKLVDFGGTGISMKDADYDSFKKAAADRTANNSGQGILCWINTSNNVVTALEEQYRP